MSNWLVIGYVKAAGYMLIINTGSVAPLNLWFCTCPQATNSQKENRQCMKWAHDLTYSDEYTLSFEDH